MARFVSKSNATQRLKARSASQETKEPKIAAPRNQLKNGPNTQQKPEEKNKLISFQGLSGAGNDL
eukprot:703559-Amphidinium_carterae.1